MADDGLIEAKMIGKTCVIKDRFASPIQAEDFIFEMMAYMEVLKDHSVCVIKHSHPSLRQCFPDDFKSPISIEHGKKLAAWCASAGSPAGVSAAPATITPQKASGSVPDKDVLKKELWALTVKQHGGVKARLRQWLTDECDLDPSKTLEDLTAEELKSITAKAKAKLGQLV